MDENMITTDAEVILMMYRDYKELSAKCKYLEEEKDKYRDTLVRIVNLADRKEIERARRDYYSRKDVEDTLIYVKEIRAAAGFPVGICKEADEILKERESKEDGEANDNN